MLFLWNIIIHKTTNILKNQITNYYILSLCILQNFMFENIYSTFNQKYRELESQNRYNLYPHQGSNSWSWLLKNIDLLWLWNGYKALSEL